MEIFITRPAKDAIRQEASENNIPKTVRIYADSAKCSFAHFSIAFDTKAEGDDVTVIDDITVVTDTKYIPKYANGLMVDYVTEPKCGFIIESLNPVKKTCASEGSGCSGCSSCSGCKGK